MQELLLHLETSSTVCSVAISRGNEILSLREIDQGFTHAENLHLFVKEALEDSKIKIEELNGIAISKGPGSYTGLRIGVSAAKGYAFALQIPLISVDTLKSMVIGLRKTHPSEINSFVPMIDARREEVFCGIISKELHYQKKVCALILNENNEEFFSETKPFIYFGSGAKKAIPYLKNHQNSIYIEGNFISSSNLIEIALSKFRDKDFESIAYFEPYYLKEFYTPNLLKN